MEMDTDSESEVFKPLEIKEEAYDEEVEMSSLPEKSKKLYMTTYDSFMKWRKEKGINSFSQSVFLEYFTELATKYKPSSLWSHYSMIRSTVNIHHGINIESYIKLRALLRQKSEGFQPKKVRTFSAENINEFLSQASDEKYLATKVAIIMGVTGACRSNEMYSMKLNDLQDLGSAFLVSVPNTNNTIARTFTVAGIFYPICKKYIDSRPSHGSSNVLFLNYQNGRCTVQRIGINKFTKMGKEIASFLKLPNPERYSGHSLRRSSASLLVNTGTGGNITILKPNDGLKSTEVLKDCKDVTIKTGEDITILKHNDELKSMAVLKDCKYVTIKTGEDITILKRNDGLKSTAVVEDCKDVTIKTEMDTNEKDVTIKTEMDTNEVSSSSSIQLYNNSTGQTSIQSVSTKNQSITLDINCISAINLTNCTNIVININK